MGGSSGILLILLGLFFLVSFVTGRLDWLRRLQTDAASAGVPLAGAPAAPFGSTGAAPTTAGGRSVA